MNEHLLKGIVRIKLPDGRVNGPGYYVSKDGHILTCFHTVKPAIIDGKVQVVFPDGTGENALVISKEKHHCEDIALLKVESSPEVAFNLAPYSDFSGQGLVTYGFPENMDKGMYGYGTIGDKTAKGWLQLSSREIRSGFSGGPVIISGTNDSIGIIKNEYIDTGEIVAQFCIPSDVILKHFPHLKPQYQAYDPKGLHKYKCLVVHHENKTGDFDTLCVRSEMKKMDETVIFKSINSLFRDGYREDKFKASIQQSNGILLWICGNDFFKAWKMIRDVMQDSAVLTGKDILLVNVGENDPDFFQEEYRSCFENAFCYPADDEHMAYFPGNDTFQKLLPAFQQNENSVFDHFLSFFNSHLVSFQDKLAERLQEFDFNFQEQSMLHVFRPEAKFTILQLTGSEQCGLEVLAKRLMKITEPSSPLSMVIDFKGLTIHNQDDLLGFLYKHTGKSESGVFDDWQAEAYKNDGDVFYVFQNFLLPEFPLEKSQKHVGLVKALADKLEKAHPPESWKGRIFFLLLNKSGKDFHLSGENCQVINLPRVTHLNTIPGQKEIKKWQDETERNRELPPSLAHRLKANIPDTPYVGKFIKDICTQFNFENLYYQQLTKL